MKTPLITNGKLQSGTHQLSNYSRLHIGEIYETDIELSFCLDKGPKQAWYMNQNTIHELIELLQAIAKLAPKTEPNDPN